jgi:preprotein translocase SecE subunit
MANSQPKKKRRIRQAETVRQKAEKSAAPEKKSRRVRRVISTAAKPVKAAHKTGKKEYYLPIPETRIGKFLNKRRRFIPSYFRNSFNELKEVKWPNRKQTVQLTLAVFAFAITFGAIITVVDYILDKIFKNILIK